MTRILVVGRDGQLGCALQALLASEERAGAVFLGREDLDLERLEQVAPAIRGHAPQVLVNAAAYTAVDQAEDEAVRAFRINAEAPGELAGAARGLGIPMVHISTDYVFAGNEVAARSEEDPTGPLGVYGRSKLAGEAAVLSANPDALVLRTSWLFSPYGRNFVKTMLALASQRSELRVVDDQQGNPTSAADLARAVLIAAEQLASKGLAGRRVYHVAGEGTASWAGLAEHVMRASASVGGPSCNVIPIPSSDWPARAPRPMYSSLNSSAFHRDFGFHCPPWRDAVAEVVSALVRGCG